MIEVLKKDIAELSAKVTATVEEINTTKPDEVHMRLYRTQIDSMNTYLNILKLRVLAYGGKCNG